MDRDNISSDPRDDIIEALTEEMNNSKRRLREIKDQIDQMQLAVDREQQKYSSIATELRNIKDNLDTVPREDIRDKYDEALEVRFRLATMRGQLEKFESNYEYLENQQTLLNQILGHVQGVEILPDGEEDSVGRRQGIDIVGIINAQEEERQRLSRQMHDGPAQSLTNFILQTEICQRLFDRNPERAAEELDNLKDNASQTFQKVRDFIFDLRPMMLDDLGVAPTVKRYSESYGEQNDIEINLEILNQDRRLENYREVFIFRSIQDVLVLARDYSSPSQVQIRLDMNADPVKILIEDNGRGFNADAVFNPEEDDHGDARVMNLVTLRSKIELIGGSISIESGENEGTTIRLEIPTDEF